jgi:hypothetical protein
MISARKSAKAVQGYVEWLYALLNYGPSDHIGAVRYARPHIPYPAQFWTTNTGVPVHSKIICGHNPYLVARLASYEHRDVHQENVAFLRWTEPDQLICDERTYQVVQRIKGRTVEAPVNLPLLTKRNA